MAGKKEGIGVRAKESLRKLIQHPAKALVVMVLDTLFFVLLGFVTAPLYLRILAYAQALFAVLGKQSPEVIKAAAQGQSTLTMPGISPYLTKLALVYLVLLVVVYLVYCFIQGLAWWQSASLFSGKQNPVSEYLVPFFKLNLLWVPLFGLYHLFTLYLDFKVLAVTKGSPYPTLLVALRYFFMLLFSYAIVFSYAFIPSEKKIGAVLKMLFTRFFELLPVYILLWASLLVLHIVLLGAFSVSVKLGIVAGILLALPWAVWMRLVLMRTCKEITSP